MYKQKRYRNRRGQSSGNKNYGGNNYRSRGPRNNWRRKNRRLSRQSIPHSMYISKATGINDTLAYIPQNSFYDFRLSKVLSKNISDMGYINPTKIQDQAIPEILKGTDILGIGSTGTGKTGAFLIPMIEKVLNNTENKILIITPTRELATQINAEFRKFAKDTNLRMALVIGGASMRGQIHLLRGRPQFVVATPGRLMDVERRRYINLKNFNNIVLDEVDQMLDMGFVNDIKMLIGKLSDNRQSLFFSATVSKKEEVLANTLLKNPIKVEADKQAPLKSIHQDIVKIQSKDQKIRILHELLIKTEFSKVLIFSGTKVYADKISNELRKKGIRIDSLHGGKSQNKRTRVLTSFRLDKIDVLVATDVAARGIDIPDISHVINFDEPATYNDYIHRIGRTGRLGKKGTALTFVLGSSPQPFKPRHQYRA